VFFIYIISIFFVLSMKDIYSTGFFKYDNNYILITLFMGIDKFNTFMVNSMVHYFKSNFLLDDFKKLFDGGFVEFYEHVHKTFVKITTKKPPKDTRLYGLEIFMTYILMVSFVMFNYYLIHVMINSNFFGAFEWKDFFSFFYIMIPHLITYIILLTINRKSEDYQYFVQTLIYIIMSLSYFFVDYDKLLNDQININLPDFSFFKNYENMYKPSL